MRFTASTPILDKLAVGDVFVGEPSAAAPVGYLRKVNKISKEGAEVILETSQAKLTDAIHQGTLNVEGQLGKSQLNNVTPLLEGAYGGVSQTPSSDLSPQIDFGNGFNFQTGVDIILEAKGTNGEATVHFKGDVRFNVGYKIAIDIGFLADLNSIEASLGFDEHVGISIDADASGFIKKEWEIARFDFNAITFFIGPIPVILVPSAKLTLGLDGTASVHFDYRFAQDAAFVQGVRWDEDNGWKRIDRNEFKISHEGPNFEGKLELTAYARANMRVLLYGVVGPDVGATIGAKLDVAYPRDPLWRLYGLAAGDVAFTIDLLGEEERFEQEIFRIEKEIASGEAKPPVITILNPNPTIDLLFETDLRPFVKVEDQLGATLTFSSDKDGGVISEKYKFFTDGPRTITITAKSASGKTAQAFINVNVINTPPEAAQLDDLALNSGQGDELFMSLSASQPKDKNTPLTCDNVRWSVIGSDSLITEQNSSVGCQAIAVFAEQGTRQVKVTVTDPQGLSTERTFDVAITEPSAVKSPKVKFIEVAGIKPQAVLQSTTPMNASIAIVNPDNLAVSYKWSWKNDPLGSYPGFTATGVGTSSTLNVVAGVTEIDTGIDGKRFLCRAVDSGGNSIYTNAKLIVEVAFEGISKVQTRDFRFSCVPLQPK